MTLACMFQRGLVFRKRVFVERGASDDIGLWQREVSTKRLSRETFQKLLEEPFWELGTVPFLINGYELFYPYPITLEHDGIAHDLYLDNYRDESIEYLDLNGNQVKLIQSYNVVRVYREVLNHLRKKIICLEDDEFVFSKKDSFYDIGMFRSFCNLKQMSIDPLLISTLDVIEWAILQEVALCQELQDVLQIAFSTLQAKFNPQHTRIWATAQTIWHFEHLIPIEGDKGIESHWLIKKLCRYKSDNTLRDIVKQVDPRPDEVKTKPKKGMSFERSSPFPLREIPGILLPKKEIKYRDPHRLKVVCETVALCLKELQPGITFQQIIDHEIITLYLGDAPKIINEIAHRWILSIVNSL